MGMLMRFLGGIAAGFACQSLIDLLLVLIGMTLISIGVSYDCFMEKEKDVTKD